MGATLGRPCGRVKGWLYRFRLRHAHGGIVTKPTLGLFGEAGPEAYIPLDAHGGRFMERLGFGNRVEQTIIFELSGREIARRLS